MNFINVFLRAWLLRLLLLLSPFLFAFVCDAQESFTLSKTIPLPGVKGRFDHFAIDTKGQRLFVAALGNNTLEVMDLAEGKHLKSVGELHKPTGVAYVPEKNQIVVGNGSGGTVKIFDGYSFRLQANVGSLSDADNVRFDAKANLLYAGYGDGALAIIDAVTLNKSGSIQLSAHPESFQLEQRRDRIFVNIPDAKQVAVIDRQTKSVSETWAMKDFQSNFPMALDEEHKRLLVGCRNPPRLVVFDTENGKIAGNVQISADTDDLFYDARLKRIYISCGEGFLDIVDQQGPNDYKPRERIKTRPGARTCLFSAERRELYLAVPERGTSQGEIRIFKTKE